MSPYRSPYAFQTSTPGDAFLDSSIVLEASGVHKQAVSFATSSPSTTTTTPTTVQKKSEHVLVLMSKDYCPSATNGVDITATVAGVPIKTIRVCGKMLTSCLEKLKATGKGVMPSTVASSVAAAAAVVAVPEDDDASSVDPGNGACGTSSDSDPIQSKTVRFNQGLWGLESMSKSIYIEAYLDGAAEESPEELSTRVDNLLKNLGIDVDVDGGEGDAESTGDCHDYAGAKGDVMTSSFILINLRNDLSGDGGGYLQMQTLDEIHRGDSEVAHCGTGFQSTCSA